MRIMLTLALCTSAAAMQAQQPPCMATAPGPANAAIIRNWGSFQMEPLLLRWQTGFEKLHPEIHFEDHLCSTVSAISGLYTGVAEIGVLGRAIWPDETLAFHSVTGSDPVEVEVATGSVDIPKATFALGIFVNKDNPLAQLTLAQLESIFRADGPQAARNWGELGLAGGWKSQPIHTYGFDFENDKSIFFAHTVMHGSHRWNASMREFENVGSVDAGTLILDALAKDPDGIAISNPHYANSQVKLIAIAETSAGPYLLPTRETVTARTYPLARSVYLYARRGPDGRLPAAVAAFLRYVLSPEGQAAIAAEGEYLPLPAARAHANLGAVEK